MAYETYMYVLTFALLQIFFTCDSKMALIIDGVGKMYLTI